MCMRIRKIAVDPLPCGEISRCGEILRKYGISIIVHVNFDHAWVEHYPLTLIKYLGLFANFPVTYTCIDL